MKQKLLVSLTIIFFLLQLVSYAGEKLSLPIYNQLDRHNISDTPIINYDTITQNYLLKNDGSIVYFKKFKWKAGALQKHEIIIDGEDYDTKDVRGYQYKGIYFGRMSRYFIKRIIHGKVNVYIYAESDTHVSSATGMSYGYNYSEYYIQVGEFTDMKKITKTKELAEALSDCPLAAAYAESDYPTLKKALKEDPDYFNSIFQIYNNGCKRLSKK